MKIVCYAQPTENGLLLHYPSKEIKQQILHLWEGAKENYNGYLKVDLQKPYKSRTTGKGSQNNKFYALITEICKETGNDLGDVKDELKSKNENLFERNTILLNENERLKKENAELKEKLKPENCLKLLAKDGYVKFTTDTTDQLAQAKEIIEDFMITETGGIGYSKLYDKAEQFLKEIQNAD